MLRVGKALFLVINIAVLGLCAADPTWNAIDGRLKFVSVGSKGVWGVNSNDDIYYRSGTQESGQSSGRGWEHIAGKLKQISSGHSVWGVNANDDIFIRQGVTASTPTGTDWLNIAGKLKQLDVSSTANQVWGVNSNDNIYRRTGISSDEPAGTNWEQIDGLLKHVSVGPAGVWGVNANDDIFYRTGTFRNEASAGSGWEHIAGKLKQISSGDNIVWGVNVNDDIFIREGISSSTPAGTGWRQIPGKLKQVEASPGSQQAWGVNSGDLIYHRTSPPATDPSGPTWNAIDGRLKFVSVGSKGVWGVNSNDDIYYRTGTQENGQSSGSGWENIAGKLMQISSGHSVWGVNVNDDIFIRQGVTASSPTGTSWLNVAGKLKQLDVSSTANQVWGVNSNDNIYRRTGISTDEPAGTSWEQLDGLLKFVSVGPAGVWGVNRNDDIFYRTGTFGNEASAGSGWEHIAGKLKQISSGDNVVWGVNVNDDIFIREGISSSNPTGTGWRKIPGKLKQIEASSSGQQAWGVNSGDLIFQRNLNARRLPSGLQLTTIDGYSVRTGDCPGNDIWSIYGDGITLQHCANRCASHSDCVAFMFFDNKRCFPKTKTCRDTTKDNPRNVFYDKEVAAQQLLDVEGYTVRVGDCPGNDIWSIYGDGITLEDCAERCTSHPDCVAFMFFDNKRCFPKTKTCKDTSKDNPKNVFYDKKIDPPPVASGFTARRGDCPGNDIWSIYGDGITLEDCAERCTSHPDCVAFMFHDNKRCFPKTKTCKDTTKDNPKNVFYDKRIERPPAVNGFSVRRGDCPGNDIWSIYGDGITLQDCADRCASHPDCVSFMFHDNKRCFPKTETCEDTSKDNPKNVFYDKDIVLMTASSKRGPGFSATYSKLDLQETATTAGAWSAQKPWLMFDFGRPKKVTSVVTQGRSYSPDWPGESHSEWVTSYSISFGNESGDDAWYFGNDGEIVVFEGNTDRDSKVRHGLSEFSGPITARYVKIHPRTWHGWVSMRAELGTDPYSDV
ncbi:uncharacterized protein LOC144873668 [Branchiostoma floridae x Branchiostoma japonicum]